MTKKELIKNIQEIIEHYRQDLIPVEKRDGLASICKICWSKEQEKISQWLGSHLSDWKSEK